MPIVESRTFLSALEVPQTSTVTFSRQFVAKPQCRAVRPITPLFLPLLVDCWPTLNSLDKPRRITSNFLHAFREFYDSML